MHILQPKHSKLNEKESQELLKKLNISKSQLPKIFSSDPAIQDNANVGDIIKIERKTPEGKPSIYYRVIV